MKVKEIERTANICWSPANQYPIYVATGTAAQQLDATFSTSAAVELYEMDLTEPGLEMKLVKTMPSDCRYHKLLWGSHGMQDGQTPNGIIVGGTDNGTVMVWDAAKVISGEESCLHKLTKHVGAVAALDINPFQSNLLATGASESEIYIWDLNNTANPMTPGAKSQPPDDVTCLAWNHQVQHILASTYAGRCVVWDLRKNEPIIKVSDSMSRIKCKLVAWHPEVATQMCLASEDDHTPVIQLWDLRFATSPLKSLENHQRGILSMAWCLQDPDLLLTCGKDNRILCWNPNSLPQSGEVIYELPTCDQWSFDVQWCPRNPGLISSCSFDGHISVHSLMGGTPPPALPSSKIADSFPTDPFSQASMPQQHTQPEQQQSVALKKAPKWLRRPVGAHFAFGGRLVTFENVKPLNPQQPAQRLVNISQVVTENDLVARSNQLESALSNNQFVEFCDLKITNCKDDTEEQIWKFMKVQFDKDPRTEYLKLLGYDKIELARKVTNTMLNVMSNVNSLALTSAAAAVGGDVKTVEENAAHAVQCSSPVDPAELSQKMAMLDPNAPVADEDGNTSSSTSDGVFAFDQIAADGQSESRSDSPLPIATDDFEAVDFSSMKIEAVRGGIGGPRGQGVAQSIRPAFDGLVTQALMMANFEVAVDVCLQHKKMAEAIILAIAGGPELLVRTQKKYFETNRSNLGRLISSLVTRNFEHIVRTCELENWKEALGMALTYAKADEFANLCDTLGWRLETEQGGEFAWNACLCYICAGNVDKLVSCWNRFNKNGDPSSLQDLVEKVMILRKAVHVASGQVHDMTSDLLAERLSQYSELLAAQGSLLTAINYLGTSQQPTLALLRDRLYHAMGQSVPGVAIPQKPFNVLNVMSESAAQPNVAQTPRSQAAPAQRQRTNSGYYQATAGGQFQTTTTPVSTYYSQTQTYTQSYNGTASPAPTPSMYNPVSSAAAPLSKGPGRYPSQAISQAQPQITPMSAPYDPYAAQNPYNTAYGAPASQPNIFNPAEAAASAPQSMYHQTPGAPYAASQPSQVPNVPSFQEVRPTSAWNDPPLVTGKNKQAPAPYAPPEAITQPIYGVPQPQEQTPPGAPNYGTQIYNPQAYQHQMQEQMQQQQHQQHQQMKQEPPKPKPKPPIPSEHQVLQDIFDKLANSCITAAHNPQMKKKLEDVLRKLETLYDKLRDQALSANVLTGLHQIIQAIQQYDYQTGLAYHTQMISQGNFSEISSFMPGVKILMQTASQLQVYVQ